MQPLPPISLTFLPCTLGYPPPFHLIVEDASKVVAVGEHLRLPRQVGAPAVDEIEAGQPALLRDLLQPQVLLGG